MKATDTMVVELNAANGEGRTFINKRGNLFLHAAQPHHATGANFDVPSLEGHRVKQVQILPRNTNQPFDSIAYAIE